jgi:hypothetical protein
MCKTCVNALSNSLLRRGSMEHARYVRLYTDERGESHFEDVVLADS